MIGREEQQHANPLATSDCWQSPQLQGGLDHAPVSRQLLHGGLFQRLPSKLISARSGDRGEDREVRDEKKLESAPAQVCTVFRSPCRTGMVCVSPD